MRIVTDTVEVRTGMTGDEQETNFMNATLQSGGSKRFEFSIATHLDLPDHEDIAEFATEISSILTAAANHVNKDSRRTGRGIVLGFEVEVGLSGRGDEY